MFKKRFMAVYWMCEHAILKGSQSSLAHLGYCDWEVAEVGGCMRVAHNSTYNGQTGMCKLSRGI